ncbi:MAG TPA: GreA/GreB family elongation factor [Polyangiaceae bacterium]|nr:GreA/GreB family elongation factor [Polyangiaceae bacterium]
MSAIDKQALLQALRERVQTQLADAKARAKEAAEGATHEENRAESDKDMRSTEASYVARGHAELTGKLEAALNRLSALEVKAFGPNDGIETGALVELALGSKRWLYFLVPAAGGERLPFAGREVLTLTPQSPMGTALLGLGEGDEAEVASPQGSRMYEVVSVR